MGEKRPKYPFKDGLKSLIGNDDGVVDGPSLAQRSIGPTVTLGPE